MTIKAIMGRFEGRDHGEERAARGVRAGGKVRFLGVWII